MTAVAPTRTRTWLSTLALLLLVPVVGQAQEKPPLGHDDHERWNRVQGDDISPDGAWIHYSIEPREGDGTLYVRQLLGGVTHTIERGANASFTRDSRFVVFLIDPTEEAQEAAREDRDTPQPADSLGILDLSTGDIERMARVDGFTLPSESAEWVLIQREDPDEDEDEEEEEEEQEEEEEEEERDDRDKDVGSDLHYRNLRTGAERVFRFVTDYEVNEEGTRFVYAASSENGQADGVFVVRADADAAHPLLVGEGAYERLTIDESAEQAAFLSNRDTWAEEEEDDRLFALYLAALDGDSGARLVASQGAPGLDPEWRISANGSVSFSESGSRLFFGTATPPLPEPDEDDEMLENVEVDVWSWHDDYLQPHQLNDLGSDRRRTYDAVVHLDRDDLIVQLEDPTLESVSIADGRDADVALGSDDRPYRQRVSWDTGFTDQYLVDVYTGERELVVRELRSRASLSPEGRYLYWWDGGDFEGTLPRGWMVMDVESRQVVNATELIPHAVHDVLDDRPSPPSSEGMAGWTDGDDRMIVYDAHDVWSVDPAGAERPVNLTEGFGRENDLRLRVVRLNWEDPEVPLDEEVLLSAFNQRTKADGYYRTRLDRPRTPTQLALEDVSFGSLAKAEDADALIFTKSTFQEYPDLWTSDADFRQQRRLTDANPQQDEYNWGTAELVTWTSADGEELQGILYKPENFDPSQQWPMMVYFYERSSNGLHNYYTPGTGTSINRAFYVSRGYVLFVPDIPYKAGYPGESAMNAVIPGITSLVEQGFVDPGRIGVQGHSWGGYQISYMVTRTDIFAAAEAGAPVSNMTSAYGGIRWGSGRVRQMQYETGQSRIAGTLWNAQHRYIENSPLFAADKVNTPLLILHNDEDGAVPWEEGIQYFVALRRLGKPAWLINYNGQAHGVSGEHPQKDWSIRMQQFFDHYLKDAPPPVWMVDGVPAMMKGRTLGLELVETAPITTNGSGGNGSGGGNR